MIIIQNCYKLLYIQFNFDPKLQTDFIDHSKNMKMVIDFNDYTYSEPLADGLRKSLGKDLSLKEPSDEGSFISTPLG